MLSYHCYHFKYIELNMISLKSVVERLLLNMWQTSSGIKKDNFDFLSKFDVLKRWSPSSLFTTPNGKRGVTRTCFKCLENIILRMKHVLPTALLIWLQLSLLSYQPLGRTDSDSQRTSVCTGFVWNQNKSLYQIPVSNSWWRSILESPHLWCMQ